jgi:predicted aspartyl protease
VKVTNFNPNGDLIIVRGILSGPLDPDGRPLRLVVDTGAAETVILPGVLDDLGYNPRQGEEITVMRSAVAREYGYMIRVERFDCLGHRSRRFRVNAHELPEGWNIEGLIGLSFLRQFNYEVRSLEGRICVERASP